MITLQRMHDALDQFKAVRFINDEYRGVTTVCYMVDDPDVWRAPLGLEARGSSFDNETGVCLSRPFAKFFNYHEHDAPVQAAIRTAIDNGAATFYKKIDGSMMTPVRCPDSAIWWKSKKTFTSDMAIDADRIMDRRKQLHQWCAAQLAAGNTPIFELTSPDYPIVIQYGSTARLTLLAVRSADGLYLDLANIEPPPTEVVESVKFANFDDLSHAMQTLEGEEGWVCHLNLDGKETLVKFKTAWYLSRHRALDLRERDVARSVVEDTYDDDRGMYAEMGVDTAITDAIAARVRNEMLHIRSILDGGLHSVRYNGGDRKATAGLIKANFPELMTPIMDIIYGDGNRVDGWIKRRWYEKYESGYNLRSITNPMFGVDAEE